MSAVSRRFLSFQEARAHMRKLGFRSVFEYRAWCKSGQKPVFIPSDPYVAYKTEFRGIPDFLGYCDFDEKLEDLHELVKAPRSRQVTTRKDGLRVFQQYLEQHGSNFVFIPFFCNTFLTLLMRPKSTGVDSVDDKFDQGLNDERSSRWALAPVRMALVEDENMRVRFTNLGHDPRSHGLMGFEAHRSQLFIFTDVDELPSSVSVGSTGKYERYRVKDQDLNAKLWKFYENSVHRSPLCWLSEGQAIPKDKWCQSVAEMWRNIYIPLKLPIEFDFNSIGEGSNLLVDGVPTIHRNVVICKRGYYRVNVRRTINQRYRALSGDDFFAFLVVLVLEEGHVPKGVFVFPKLVLAGNGILQNIDKGCKGREQINVFPPWRVSNIRENIRLRYRWQLEYYVDFSDKLKCRDEFRRIFDQFRNREHWDSTFAKESDSTCSDSDTSASEAAIMM